MTFKDEPHPSNLQKVALCAGILLGTLFPSLSMSESIAHSLGLDALNGDSSRQILIVTLSVVYLARFTYAMFVFVKRKISWFEGGMVSLLWFAMFYLYNSSGGGSSAPIGPIDLAGLLLYITGSYFNSGADYQRYAWKRDPGNSDRLCTGGLFKYSMHINYFGDSLVYFGMAMVAREFMCFVVALVITLNFIFLQIPMQHKHLRSKYAGEFEEYARRTKRLIPFVY